MVWSRFLKAFRSIIMYVPGTGSCHRAVENLRLPISAADIDFRSKYGSLSPVELTFSI